MIAELLPRAADNNYRGHKIALWILGAVALLNGVIGVNSAVNTREVATTADGIPLDTFSAAASQTILSLFAMLGVTRIVMFLLCVVILLRYRALVPLMFAMLLVGQIGSQAIHHYQPWAATGDAKGPIIILATLAATAIGLALSLWKRGEQVSR